MKQTAEKHVPQLLGAIRHMIELEQHCDVLFHCRDGSVRVSGFLLASISPWFQKLTELQALEANIDMILPDFKVSHMTAFISQLLRPTPWRKDDEEYQYFEQVLAVFQHVDNSYPLESFNSPSDFHMESPYPEEEEDEEANLKTNDESLHGDNEDLLDTDDDESFSEEDSKPKRRAKRKVSNRLASQARSTYNEDLRLYVCPHCNLQLKAGMTNHLKWHKEHPDETYPSRSTCEHCGKTFKKIGILRAHIVRMHSNMPKKFKCTFEGCERAFKMRGELNTHYLIHTNAKNFICTECGLGFRTKMAMDSHTLRKHTNLKPSIPCEECGKLFKVRSDLYSHAMTHKARKERIHRCDDCNLTFRTEKSLARHLELHDPSRPLACSKCPLRYKNKDQLVRHVQTHEKPDIECELCHRVFGRPDHLKRHIATRHSTLSVVEQMYLSDSVNKKKIQPKPPPKSSAPPVVTTSAPTLPSAPIPEVHLTTLTAANVLHKLEPLALPTQPAPPVRTESELSTISVTELGSVIQPQQAFPVTSPAIPTLISAPSAVVQGASLQPQYRQPQIDYSPMFQLTLPSTATLTNPEDL